MSVVDIEVKKAVMREYSRKWRAANPDKARAHTAKYAGANSGKKRKKRLERKYGMSQDQWDAMFLSQGKCCAICSSEEPKSPSGWATDHCHTTNKVRGILCPSCNSMLGMAKDKVSTLNSAIKYLERHQSPNIEGV